MSTERPHLTVAPPVEEPAGSEVRFEDGAVLKFKAPVEADRDMMLKILEGFAEDVRLGRITSLVAVGYGHGTDSSYLLRARAFTREPGPFLKGLAQELVDYVRDEADAERTHGETK